MTTLMHLETLRCNEFAKWVPFDGHEKSWKLCKPEKWFLMVPWWNTYQWGRRNFFELLQRGLAMLFARLVSTGRKRGERMTQLK